MIQTGRCIDYNTIYTFIIFYYDVCGCMNRHDLNDYKQYYINGNILNIRGSPNTPKKYSEYSYPILNSFISANVQYSDIF
jgi:hypothetical protein